MSIPARSYLYVPGDRPDRMRKAASRGADAVILDLEDGVAVAAKDQARRNVSEFLRTPPPGQWWVRVDGHRLDDVEAVVHESLTGIVLPGADPGALEALDAALSDAERSAGMVVGRLRVIALVETARALLRLEQITAAKRVLRLGIGEADLAAELGVRPSPDSHELWPIRSSVVVASAAARLAAPIGPVQIMLDDPDELARSTRTQLRQGFRARTAIHPRQIRIINEAFSPTADEIAAAQAAVESLEAAERQGTAVVRGPDGSMIDAATIRSAREVLARASFRHASSVEQRESLTSESPDT